MTRRFAGLLMVMVGLAGCALPVSRGTPAASVAPADCAAYRFELLADPAALLAALPPDLADEDLLIPTTPADPAALAAWASPATHWRSVAATAGQLDGYSSADALAELADFDAALAEGTALVDLACSQGRAVSADAVLAELAWRLIAHAHPLRADAAMAEAESAVWAGYWRGADSPASVIAGRHLGAAAAQAIIGAYSDISLRAA